MIALITLLVVVPLISGQKTFVNQNAGKHLYYYDQESTLNSSYAICTNNNQTMVTINSEQEMNWIINHIAPSNFWLGAVATHGHFPSRWLNGDFILYTPWRHTETGSDANQCSAAVVVVESRDWVLRPCSYTRHTICETKFAATHRQDDTYVFKKSLFGKEYYYHHGAFTFNYARAFCDKLNSSMATFSSMAEQTWVRNHVALTNRFWLGVYSTENEDNKHNYRSVDNSSMHWTHWYANQPDCYDKNCCAAYVDTDNTWMDEECHGQQGVVCQRSIGDVATNHSIDLISGSLFDINTGIEKIQTDIDELMKRIRDIDGRESHLNEELNRKQQRINELLIAKDILEKENTILERVAQQTIAKRIGVADAIASTTTTTTTDKAQLIDSLRDKVANMTNTLRNESADNRKSVFLSYFNVAAVLLLVMIVVALAFVYNAKLKVVSLRRGDHAPMMMSTHSL